MGLIGVETRIGKFELRPGSLTAGMTLGSSLSTSFKEARIHGYSASVYAKPDDT